MVGPGRCLARNTYGELPQTLMLLVFYFRYC